jgi:hypothetical protein
MIVVFDTNIWLRHLYLRAPAGAEDASEGPNDDGDGHKRNGGDYLGVTDTGEE